jgi:hypothetical protein
MTPQKTPPPSRETRQGKWADNIHNCQLKLVLKNNMDKLIAEALKRRKEYFLYNHIIWKN